MKAPAKSKLPWIPKKEYARKGRSLEQQKFYQSRGWRMLTKKIRTEQPLCRECEKQGRVTVGTQRDHILPIEQFPELALHELNVQNLCLTHHNQKTAIEKTLKTKQDFINKFANEDLREMCLHGRN